MADTPRLPNPGHDDGTWGDILNDFLLVSHNADGTIKAGAAIDAGGNPIINLADPTDGQDAATKFYVDNTVGNGQGLPTGWTVHDATGELHTTNPDDGDADYNVITFQQPSDADSWNAWQVLDDDGNYLGGFDGDRFQAATPDQAVARLSATNGISLLDSSHTNIFNVGTDGSLQLGTGEIRGGVFMQQQPNATILFVQGSGEQEVGIFKIGNRTGGETTNEIFTVEPWGDVHIKPAGSDVVPLSVKSSGADATSNLQEWQDSDGNAIAWLAADGTPGGTLTGGGSGTGLPVGDPALFSLDTSTYTNDFDDGAYHTAVFGNPAPAFVIAQVGDEYPRWLMASDATDGLYLGDGTFDPYDNGAAMWTDGVPEGLTTANINLAGSGIMLTVGQIDPADASNPTITAWGDLQLTDLQQTVGVVFRARQGDPNGAVAGRQGDVVIDGQTPAVWQCTATGDADTAVWARIGGSLFGGGGDGGGDGTVPGWFIFLSDEPVTGENMAFIESQDSSAIAFISTLPGQDEDPSGGMLGVATMIGDGDGGPLLGGQIQLDSFPDFSMDEFGQPRLANLQILRNENTDQPLTIMIGDFFNDVADFMLFAGGTMVLTPSFTIGGPGPNEGFLIDLQTDIPGQIIEASASQTANLQEWQDSDANALAWIAADGTPGGTLATVGSGEIMDLIVQDNSHATIFEVNSDDGVVIKLPGATDQLVIKDSGDDELFSVTGGGPATEITFWATGEVMKMMSDGDDPALSFFGASPSWQQSASDGSSLVSALVSYGLLESGSSWTDPGVDTSKDFFITGDNSLDIAPNTPGVGLGVETNGNSNGHIEIVSPTGGIPYIDFTTVGVDHKVRMAWDDTNSRFDIDTAGHVLTINSSGLLLDDSPVGGTTMPVAQITGSITMPYPMLFNLDVMESVPLDPASQTYGNFKTYLTSPAFTFPAGGVATYTSFVLTGVDTTYDHYNFKVRVVVSNADGSNAIIRSCNGVAQAGTTGDGFTVIPGYLGNEYTNGGDLSYDTDTGIFTSASGGTYTVTLTVEASWV